MPHNPLISVIFPVLQWDQITEKAFASLQEQTYSSIEIITVYYDNVEKTANEAVNEGLKTAKGDFVTFLMPADYYAPERIARCVERLQQERAEFLFTHVHAINELGQSLKIDHDFWVWRQNCDFHSNLLPTIGFKLLQDMLPVTLGNIILSKRVTEKIGELKRGSYAAYEYVLEALLYAEPIFFKEELYFYRISETETRSDSYILDQQTANEVRKHYLLKISKPPENKQAPCHHYWPMTFSTFRLNNNMDEKMGISLHEIANQSVMPLPSFEMPKERLGAITLLIHDLSLSGAPRVAADLALALKQKGYAPKIISFSDGPLRPFFDRFSIPVQFIYPNTRYWFFKNGYKKVLFLLSMAWQMLTKSTGTTIAVASLTWSALFVGAFFFPFRKFVWYLHDSYPPEGIVVEGLPFRLLKKCLLRKNLRFWFGSHATRKIWENAEIKGDVVYWSGIQKNEIALPKRPMKTVLSVGAGYPRKGAHFLLDAFMTCIRENTIPEDVKLVIVGFSDTLQDLKDFVSDIITKVHESGFEHRIQLVKSVNEAQLEELYESCDLYVQPSFLECLPLAMLKAMSKGIPIITAHVDGCNEAIVDGINGYTCPPRNNSILAKKISHAINHREESYQLGMEGQKTFNEKFSLEATKEEFFATLSAKSSEPAFTSCISQNTNKKAIPLTELV